MALYWSFLVASSSVICRCGVALELGWSWFVVGVGVWDGVGRYWSWYSSRCWRGVGVGVGGWCWFWSWRGVLVLELR